MADYKSCTWKFDIVLERARKLFNNYCLKKESEEELHEPRKNFKDGRILGCDNFAATIRETCEQKITLQLPLLVILESACIIFCIEMSELLSPSQSRHISLIRGGCCYPSP